MDDTQKRAIVEHFLGLYAKGRWGAADNTEALEELLSCLTDDVEWWMSGAPGDGYITKEQFRAMLKPLDTLTDGPLVITPTAWTIQGARVAVEAYSTMKLKNRRDYRNHYHFLFEISGGKISTYHEHHDTAHVNSTMWAG
ncbi:nuclear transport factor 2 family protein [Streptomyces sp. NPDC054796]